ncbi:MAG: type II secretion system F family protein [Deltaproteobacteria bacterium]|nr:type II secretion system F family protein [Deltaproteobacteria bacterium]
MAPVYEYVSLNEVGKRVKGILDAESPSAVRQKLRARGLRILEVMEVAEKRSSGWRFETLWPRMSSRDVGLLLRRFATLLDSGLPLVECIEALLEQTGKPVTQKVLGNLRERVLEGEPLWQAMARHPRIFTELQVNMIRAGESSGSLDIVLLRLADLMEARLDLQNRVRAALAYPSFMLVVGTGVLFFLISFVIPQITSLFRETGQQLPWPTTFLIHVSSWMQRFWWVGMAVVVAGLVLWKRFVRTHRGKRFKARLLLRLPVARTFITRLVVARFARTLGALLSAGMPLLTALGTSRTVLGNAVFSDAVEEVEKEVGEGKSLNETLKAVGVFPAMAVHMVHSGEKSGKLEDMLIKVADTYEKEVSTSLTIIMSLLEPVMILGMAMAVGFIVVAVLLPIFEMTQGIR